MKYRIILLAILLALPLSSAIAKEEKPKKLKIEDRVERLEALGEYLLTRDTLTSVNGASSSADCGLTVEFDFGGGFIATGIARDTIPTSVPGPVSGALRFLGNDGCDGGLFPAASEPTDIIAIPRGVCLFVDKVQNAADAGYAAAIIFNTGIDPFNFEGQLLASMGAPEGRSYVIPTVAMNARDGQDLGSLEGIPTTINGPAEFCTTNE